MKISFRIPYFNIHFFLSIFKVKKGTGITSKISDSPYHILLFDLDTKKIDVQWFKNRYAKYPMWIYETENGYHAIVYKVMRFDEAARELLLCPWLDKTWFALGVKRGYWFLRNRFPLLIPKKLQVQFMEIEYAESQPNLVR